MEQLENRMVVDSEWDETEYGIPDRHRMEMISRDKGMEKEFGESDAEWFYSSGRVKED